MFKKSYNYFNSEQGRRVVQIEAKSGNLQIITADFDESLCDWDSLSEKELIDKALEWQYRTYMQGKFVNEAVEITEAKAKEVTELAEKLKGTVKESEAELAKIKERAEISQGSILEMTEMMYDHEARIAALESGDEKVDEPIEEDKEHIDTEVTIEGGE
ncbi:hypothetical protein KBI51_08930 [Aerococcaceae bacterium zg-ZUI334]|uniref:hypothetical protein n=1 Tax=Aerococcaceae bacterium zg-252 TaxID=2796928 RepID=UPI001B92ABEE|nr:hypothetical protein [Aerococcaceae bacterium zg-ZUI334]